MTLIEFLRARLDDRHARAAKLLRYAQENDVAVRDPDLLGRRIPGWHDWPEVEQMAREVLAEVDAKRRMIDVVLRYEEKIDGEWGCCHSASAIGDGDCPEAPPDEIEGLRLLALPYADHPDYDPSWWPA